MNPREKIRARIAALLERDIEDITDATPLTELVVSSVMLVELIIDLQEEFDVRFGQAEMQQVASVGQLIDLYCELITAPAH